MKLRVLLAVDGSEAADRAVELCASIAWPEDTKLRVATVVEPLNPVIAGDWMLTVNERDDPARLKRGGAPRRSSSKPFVDWPRADWRRIDASCADGRQVGLSRPPETTRRT
jgi:hypothetical protein